ncbi:uncharacterized protein LOC143348910 [Colletes latitarsis]|uniref:uncharacterized protein LOC143348910 n=1 Tax=Colletes latitarsis TaxID=2605962 RepID=UPI0040372F3E
MIRTFIFFDLETTGLITKNCMPKITELSLIAVSRKAICDTTDPLPRVLHKLVLPIHPNKQISKEIHTLTGLSNETLEEVRSFNCETYDTVINFIHRLTAPTCFVAYNGNNFDYPIFLWELKNINKVLGEEIFSIDMINLTKDFFAIKKDPIKRVNNAETITPNSSITDDTSTLLNDGYDQILSDALDSIMSRDFNNTNKNESNNVLNTPKSSCYKKIKEINEKTPESQIVKINYSNKISQNRKESITRRKLDFTNSRPSNFKLSTVCKHILGSAPENAHSAEADCLTMIRCAIQLGNFFVEWADCNAVPMINYSKQ